MDTFLEQMSFSDPFTLAAGVVLLFFGRKLYWLAMGGLGFFFGQHLAEQQLNVAAEMQLGLAVLAGIVGIVLAVVVKKIAVTIGGFAIGAILAYHVAQPWAADLDTGIWWVTLLGAVLGICFAAFLLEAALTVVSSAVGAILVVSVLPLEADHQIWAVGGLAALGILVQSRGKKSPKDD